MFVPRLMIKYYQNSMVASYGWNDFSQTIYNPAICVKFLTMRLAVASYSADIALKSATKLSDLGAAEGFPPAHSLTISSVTSG